MTCPSGYFCPNADSQLTEEAGTLASLLSPGYGTRVFYDFPCPPRYMCPDGALETMQICPEGEYNDEFKQTACKDCPDGRVCYGGEVVDVCPKGTFCNQGTTTPCPKGTYNPNPGQELEESACPQPLG